MMMMTSWWFRVVFIFPSCFLTSVSQSPESIHYNRYREAVTHSWCLQSGRPWWSENCIPSTHIYNIYQWNGCFCCPNMLVLSAGLQHSIDPTHAEPRADHCNKEIKSNKATRAAAWPRARIYPSWGEALVKSMGFCCLSDCGWWIPGVLHKTVFGFNPACSWQFSLVGLAFLFLKKAIIFWWLKSWIFCWSNRSNPHVFWMSIFNFAALSIL